MTRSPSLVVHADWSMSPRKRWMARAVLEKDSLGAVRTVLHAPEPVGDPATWLDRLRDGPNVDSIFLGVDFPIGLPLAYAERVGIKDFLDLLPQLGAGEWVNFFQPAAIPDEISLFRPFYPARPGGTRQQHLLDGLGIARMDDLRRQCDRKSGGRRAAASLFWTIGTQQVGKAAIAGWHDVIGPALRERGDVRIWPFDGRLDELVVGGGLVMAESYPAEFYRHLGLAFPKGPDGRGSKRSQFSRAASAETLLEWAGRHAVRVSDELATAMRDGFSAAADGEDRFDAAVGLVGMLNVLFGYRPAGEPVDEATRRVEGWILGQAAGE